MSGDPIDGNALVLAAAKASISGERLPELVERAQKLLGSRYETYRRRYECVHEGDSSAAFFVEEGHWSEVGEELGLQTREWQALRRAHEEHLRQLGGELDRVAEFQTALDVREVVVIGSDNR